MTATEYRAALRDLPYGKRLPGAVYLVDPGDDPEGLPSALRITVGELRKRLEIDDSFNLLKFHIASPKISFLSYPDFERKPHPELKEAVIVDLISGKVRRDDYRARANPPILHRKETFIPVDHRLHAKFARLTREEEEAGLLEETSRIGFRLNWEKLLADKGVGFRAHRLVKMQDPSGASVEKVAASQKPPKVQRHRTAIVRSEISKPTKTLLELGQLRRGESFFDYGCGHGADVEAIRRMDHESAGWDPNHAPDQPKVQADVVNLGFVLNVIEDPAERVDALIDAWNHCRRLMVVSTLIAGQEAYADIQTYGDGVMTSRDTFQKFFEPSEIQALIEDSLHAEVVPVALGIYFIFRQVEDFHDFVASRSRRFIDWEALSRKLGLLKALKSKRDPYETHRELLDEFWESVLELGRLPRPSEFERIDEVRRACGSLPKALQLFIDRFGEPTFEAARQRRKEDLIVFVAAAQLRKKIPFNHLSERLQRDLRSFFGSYANAEEKARELMFAAGDEDELELAVQGLDFGWSDENEGHFTIHRSLLDELPAILRIYVECGAKLYGDPRAADLTKIHLYSGKLTFTYYEDFDQTPFPEMTMRIKVDIRRLFVNVFEHPPGPHRQLLFFKERFLPADHPGLAKMQVVSRRLRELGISEANVGHGISKGDFESAIEKAGLTRVLTKKGK
ncbi:DNA phosphorothioation-associated putative methyltransferase [Haloferula sp.]|uniref:DNA phosphorothioation-associated putative methyltransferase n=1 Tax=Haloferula sp. TaxID=2497595 RepID=UPI003C740E04